MTSKYLRITIIAVSGVFSVYLLALVFHLAMGMILPSMPSPQTGSPAKDMPSDLLFPPAIHVAASFFGMVQSLFLLDNSRNGIERRILPPMFITLILTNIHVVALHAVSAGNGYLSFTSIGRLRVFAMLFSSSLMLISGLFHFGINIQKMGQYMVVGAAFSFLVAAFAPLSVSNNPTAPQHWVADPLFPWVLAVLGIIGCISYAAVYNRERTQYNLFLCGGFMCIIIGNTLIMTRPGGPAVWSGTILYAAGMILNSSRGRFSGI